MFVFHQEVIYMSKKRMFIYQLKVLCKLAKKIFNWSTL